MKLVEIPTVLFELSLRLLSICFFVVVFCSIFLGAQSVLDMFQARTPGPSGVWLLVLMSFVSGILYGEASEKSQSLKSTLAVTIPNKGIWLVVGAFIFSVVFGTNFLAQHTLSWAEFVQVLPNSLLLAGCLLIIVVFPLDARREMEEQLKLHPRSHTTSYYIESAPNGKNEWKRVTSDGMEYSNAIDEMWNIHHKDPRVQVRIVKQIVTSSVHKSIGDFT